MYETYRCARCGRVYDNDDYGCPECGWHGASIATQGLSAWDYRRSEEEKKEQAKKKRGKLRVEWTGYQAYENADEPGEEGDDA